ncbi:MAG: GNAT family N-acetyltransferase [Actinobacteria bacterium]|nr:GNAT family N-acetyltransferase [Actinomycetota bacterium]
MSTKTPDVVTSAAATLRRLDLHDPGDEALFRRAHAEVQVPAEHWLLGERAAPRSADDLLTAARLETTYETTRGVALGTNGAPVGLWMVELPLRDNLDNAYIGITVAPGHRRRGIGTAMLDHVEGLVRATGRTVVQTWDGMPTDPQAEDPTTAFATARGYTSSLPSLRSDLDLDPPGAAGIERALAPLDAELDGRFDVATARRESTDGTYRLVTWWGAVPEEHLEDRAALMQRMSTDAPAEDMAIEEEDWDGARVREDEAICRAQGKTVVETAALHVPSGRLVAFTMLAVPKATPDLASQWDTLVLTEHRGARLGAAVKAANLRALVERFPALRRVTTYNAASNAPMLRVNFAMGYHPVLRTTCWQRRLETTDAHE